MMKFLIFLFILLATPVFSLPVSEDRTLFNTMIAKCDGKSVELACKAQEFCYVPKPFFPGDPLKPVNCDDSIAKRVYGLWSIDLSSRGPECAAGEGPVVNWSLYNVSFASIDAYLEKKFGAKKWRLEPPDPKNPDDNSIKYFCEK